MSSEKASLRIEIKAALASIPAPELLRRSGVIFSRVEQSELFARAATVALYHSLPGEPSTTAFIERWQGRKTILLPCVTDAGMLFRRFDGDCRTGCFGIKEPTGAEVSPENIDFMVVPGMAFDRLGNRLGRGKGYYDRYLDGAAKEGIDIPCIGVCFSFQYFDSIPHAPHDRRMDAVITDGE